jgi:broad specificity phosphatase PhoE
VELVEGVAPHDWVPSEQGLAAARRLATAPVWRTLAAVATSSEAKARVTAEPIAAAAGLTLRVEDDLREVRRGLSALDRGDHEARVRRYLAGDAIQGWEPKDEAKQRIDRCVRRLLADTAGPLAVVSHGTILALNLELVFDEWAAIGLPAVAVVRDGALVEPFRGVDEFLAAQRFTPG